MTPSWGSLLADAALCLTAQGMRSFLALLGISVGTAAIVAMLLIGHMVQLQTEELYRHLGVDMLSFQTGPNVNPPLVFDPPVVQHLPDIYAGVANAAPLVVRRLQVYSTGRVADLTAVGITPELFQLMNFQLREGRLITKLDSRNFVSILGAQAASKLSSSGASLRAGGIVDLNGYNFTVVGVLDPTPYTALDPADVDNSVMVPLGLVSRLVPSTGADVALVRLRQRADAKHLQERLSEVLANGQSGLQVLNARDLIGGLTAQRAIHDRLLAAIGAVSLLVGGIGTMNVMLMSVLERRSEIGLRAALGATRRSIRALFLVEAATLSLAGGALGLILGVGMALLVAMLSTWTFSIAPSVLLLGPAVAVFVGVGFGYYPAARAAKLDPIEALRAV